MQAIGATPARNAEAAPPAPPPPMVAQEPQAEPEPEPAPRDETAGEVVSNGAFAARPALRVSVEVLSRASGTFLVRMLGEGEEVPPRAYEALLVPLEHGVDLRDA
jgi:hypothetical protein